MFTIKYEDCKKFLESSLINLKPDLSNQSLSTPREQLAINQPMGVDNANICMEDQGRVYQSGRCCTCHMYIEWSLDREFYDRSQYLYVTSPVFGVGHQGFCLEMSPECGYTFRLHRYGPSVKDSFYACRAGVICFLPFDQSPSNDVTVDLSEELTEWTYVQQLFTISSSYLHNTCLSKHGKVIFFFRFNMIPRNFEEKVPIVRGPCNHGALRSTPASSTGSIVEKEWEMYKKVQWNIPCKSIKNCRKYSVPKDLSSPKMVYNSPVFEISDQKFYFSIEMSEDTSTPHYMHLHRSGPSVDMTARWWMQVKNGSNCVFVSRNLDLSRDCVGWTYDERLTSFERISESSFNVEFLMSKVDTICGVIQSSPDGDSPLELDPSRTEFLCFRVKGLLDFTVHRSLLIMRVPVFETMLSHGTVESQTGVLRIDDFHPVVIIMFLHYVDTGNGPLWSDEKFPQLIISFIAGLFAVAHKYLVPELRDMCLSLLNDISLIDEYGPTVAVEVDEYKDILSTFPKEMLQKWPMIEVFHTYAAIENI